MKQVTKYEADDGTLHDTEADALRRDEREAFLREMRIQDFDYRDFSSESFADWLFDTYDLIRRS